MEKIGSCINYLVQNVGRIGKTISVRWNHEKSSFLGQRKLVLGKNDRGMIGVGVKACVSGDRMRSATFRQTLNIQSVLLRADMYKERWKKRVPKMHKESIGKQGLNYNQCFVQSKHGRFCACLLYTSRCV